MGRRNHDLSKPTGGEIMDLRTGNVVTGPVRPVICDRIRYYRELRGLDQKTLGSLIGVSNNAVSNWENGRTRPDINLLPKISEALDATLYQLYELPEPGPTVTKSEQELIAQYRTLSPTHKYVVKTAVQALTDAEQAETCPNITKLLKGAKSLAAGVGNPTEWEDGATPVYLYSTPLIDRADYIFDVIGDSMEPEFHGGDQVLVERIPDSKMLRYGEVGAFILRNEFFIKIYEEDGLHSYNCENYGTMRFTDDDAVYLIGRVIGTVETDDYATPADIDRYFLLHDEE